MDALWNGILFGLLLTIFIGPVFFALIQTSIQKGFLAGALMAIGISLSDALYIVISYLWISSLLNDNALYFWLGLGGGIIMIAFGISAMIRSVAPHFVPKPAENSQYFFRFISKGFLLNALNPSVFIFWAGISSMATVNYNNARNEIILFFLAIVCTVFVTDIIKTFVANRLRKMLTPIFIKIINKLVGGGLIAFGLSLIYYAIQAKP